MVKNKWVRELLDWLLHIGLAVLVAFVINYFFIQMTLVNGDSMEPTLQNKNWLIMEKLSKRFGNLDRGDIVVIEAEQQLQESGQPTGHSPLIKRIIGLPGDTIDIRAGKVFVNQTEFMEDYINGEFTSEEYGQYHSLTVPNDKIFVMGDNRLPGMSLDSRRLGTFPIEAVKGRAFIRLLPMNKFGGLK